jgi:hypothetical protein
MPDLVVIVPSRGRPETVDEMADAFAETCTEDYQLLFAVDSEDPTLPEYVRRQRWVIPSGGARVWSAPNPEGSMVAALNRAVGDVMAHPPFAIAFLGDDHRPRTVGWDAAYLEALRELGTGIVYGNDLLQRHNLPTQCAMTADIVRALGWMAPPTLRHLYVDNFWLDLGRAADCIRYLPDVVVEHMHPVAGKAAVDDGYARVNAAEVYTADEAAYRQFVEGGLLAAAAATVQGLRAVTA